jgi:hypothetical protein
VSANIHDKTRKDNLIFGKYFDFFSSQFLNATIISADFLENLSDRKKSGRQKKLPDSALKVLI